MIWFIYFQVSASGVALSHDKGSLENIVDLDQNVDWENKGKTGEVGRDYIAEKYPDLIIIDGNLLDSYCLDFSMLGKKFWAGLQSTVGSTSDFKFDPSSPT